MAQEDLGSLRLALAHATYLLVRGASLFERSPHLRWLATDSAGEHIQRNEPTCEDVDELAGEIERLKPGFVVAVGGGSVLDVAKAASAVVPTGRKTRELLQGGHEADERAGRVIAVPTVGGTGAEVSAGAIITDTSRGLKIGLRGVGVMPELAVLAPSLSLSAPRVQTMRAAFDGFCHAIETAASLRARSIEATLSIGAGVALRAGLTRLSDNPSDLTAREAVMVAGMLMGNNLVSAGTCLPHRIQYVVGPLTNTAHAVALAPLLPPWIRTRAEKAQLVFAGFGSAFGQDLSACVTELARRAGLPTSLRDLGVTKEQLALIAERVHDRGTDPGPSTPAHILTLLHDAW